MDRDRYFTAEQARDYGLIDRVIASHELSRPPTGFVAASSGDLATGSSTRSSLPNSSGT
jgi:hypothetical protein